MDEGLLIGAFTWARFCEPSITERLLDALEQAETFRPTHYSNDEFARTPYDRGAILDRVRTGRVSFALTVARKKAVKYTSTFVATRDLHPSVLTAFDLVTNAGCPPGSVAAMYALADRIAAAVTPELAYVQPTGKSLGDRAEAFAKLAGLSGNLLQDYGLAGLCARTWLGAELTRRIGRGLLEDAGLVVRDTAWGGVVVDLVPEPWAAEPQTLFEKQSAAQAVLARSGMFAVYEGIDGVDTKQAPAWTPLQQTSRAVGQS